MALKKKSKKDRVAEPSDMEFDFDLLNGPTTRKVESTPAKPKAKKKKAKAGTSVAPWEDDPGEIDIERLAKKFPVALASEAPKKQEPALPAVIERPMSVVGKGQDEVYEMIEQGKWDEATPIMYRRLAQSVYSLLPYMEAEIRNTQGKKGAFNFNAMLSSARDLLADIQQAQDRGRLGELLVDKLLRPAFMDVGMIFIKEQDLLQSRLRQTLDSEQMRVMQIWLDEAQRRFVDQIQDEFRKLHDNVKEFMER